MYVFQLFVYISDRVVCTCSSCLTTIQEVGSSCSWQLSCVLQ